MPLYEHTFLARQDISTQQAEALVEQFKGVLESNGGSVGKEISPASGPARVSRAQSR